MPASVECLEVEGWQALDDATLSSEQLERWECHLEACPVCQKRISQAEDSGDALRRLGRKLGDPTEVPADPTLVQVLERLHEVKIPDRLTPIAPADLFFLQPAERPEILGNLGNYEVEDVIGQGGMGVVLKAYEPTLHRHVAIKVMAAAVAGSATARRRFTREAQAAAAVCHENIVPVYGVNEVGSLPYLVMQFVVGESLQDRLDRTGPLELAEIVRIGLQTAAGLTAAHAQGLIHRDIKPANLLLENDTGRVKITDFGLARMIDDVQLTQDGVVTGTPEYMAPEQARGEQVDHLADLFSLGSVLYAMATGGPPFAASSAVAVLRQVSDETQPPIHALNPDMPAWLDAIIARLMAKDPAQRYQSAAEVADLLSGFLAHLEQPALYPAPEIPNANGNDRQRSSAKEKRATGLLLSLLAGCLLLMALGFGLAAWFEGFGDGDDLKNELPKMSSVGLPIVQKDIFQPQAEEPKVPISGTSIVGIAAAPFGQGLLLATYSLILENRKVRGHLPADQVPMESPKLGIVTKEFYYDFRNKDKLDENFRLAGSDAAKRIKFEPEGLRITLPADRKSSTAIGVAPLFGVQGDFEITLAYEILRTDKPKASGGAGAGLEVYLTTDTPTREALGFDRRIRPNGLDMYSAARMTTNKQDKRDFISGLNLKEIPAVGKSGQLRITRIGANAVLSITEPMSKDFRILYSVPLGSEDLTLLRLAANPGAPGTFVDLRLHDFRVRSEVPDVRDGRATVEAKDRQNKSDTTAKDSAAQRALTEEMPTIFYHDFRGNPLPRELVLFGVTSPAVCEIQPEGLRTTIPKPWIHPKGGVGVRTAFGLKGDFDVTASFEFLQQERPANGYGVGVHLKVERTDAVAGLIGRSDMADGDFIKWVRTKVADGRLPCSDKAGTLRLKRIGSTLSFLYASGSHGKDFRLIQQRDFGTTEIDYFDLEAGTGRQPVTVDVRWLELRIRGKGDFIPSEGFQQSIKSAKESTKGKAGTNGKASTRNRGVAWALLFGFVITLTLALAIWYVVRRRQRREDSPVSNPKHVTEHSPGVTPESITFQCSNCQKKLKAKVLLAGQQIRCPQCGQSMPVPG
jgi:serine/threonine protein kinase/DNA-directed RNA polymerase subunit RPC12/RpoP